MLPQIGQGGHDSYGGESYSRNPSRLDNIESRLNEQVRFMVKDCQIKLMVEMIII